MVQNSGTVSQTFIVDCGRFRQMSNTATNLRISGILLTIIGFIGAFSDILLAGALPFNGACAGNMGYSHRYRNHPLREKTRDSKELRAGDLVSVFFPSHSRIISRSFSS